MNTDAWTLSYEARRTLAVGTILSYFAFAVYIEYNWQPDFYPVFSCGIL